MGGQGSKRNVISGPMGKRTGRAPANELGQGAGPVDRQGCGSGAGGLKVVVKVPWCRVAVPARGLLFCSFCLFVCFCFSLKLCPLFCVAFYYVSALWEPHLGRRQECESEEAGEVQRKAASVF